MKKTHWQEAAMNIYRIGQTLTALEQMPETGEGTLVLLTSEELDKCTSLPGLEGTLHHTPLARDARGCKGEWRRGCLCGTVTTPRHTHTGNPIAFGYLLTGTKWYCAMTVGRPIPWYSGWCGRSGTCRAVPGAFSMNFSRF